MNADMAGKLTFIFEKVSASDGGGYVAYAKELPAAISEGDTLEQAQENLEDALATLLDVRK